MYVFIDIHSDLNALSANLETFYSYDKPEGKAT